MRLRLVPLVAAAVVLAACGGQSKHAAIADYITRVNDVEQGMAGPLREVSAANRAFAKSRPGSHVERDLATSEQTMQRLRRRLSLVVPPPEAKHLHVLLMQLVGQELGLAREVHKLAVFTRRYRASLAPLQVASTTLKQQLAATAKGRAAAKKLDAAKADELTAYAATLADVRATLARLDPPEVWRPTYRRQLASLTQLRASSLALAQAIRANDAAAIPHLLERFDAAAVSNQSVAAQKQEIAAIVAYNNRIRAIVRLTQRVERERVLLQRKYG